VVDVVEVLVQWQARHSLKQIARSTGMSRNTVRRYLARVAAVGLRREPGLTEIGVAGTDRESVSGAGLPGQHNRLRGAGAGSHPS
jgi:uncharacterized protein YidB (DUF937 family)